MKSSTGTEKRSPVLTFEHPLKIEVYLPDFEPLSSLDALDATKLAKGDHRIEIGFMKAGCGKEPVSAVIKDGMVVGVEADGCQSSEVEASEEVAALVAHAVKELEGLDYWKPVPVGEFLAMVQQGSYPPRGGTGAGCFYICLWTYCLFCCKSTAKSPGPTCWIERRKPDVIMGV